MGGHNKGVTVHPQFCNAPPRVNVPCDFMTQPKCGGILWPPLVNVLHDLVTRLNVAHDLVTPPLHFMVSHLGYTDHVHTFSNKHCYNK